MTIKAKQDLERRVQRDLFEDRSTIKGPLFYSDPKHETPCPLPAPGCEDECGNPLYALTVYDLNNFLFRQLPPNSHLSALDCEAIARRMLAADELLEAAELPRCR